MINLKTGKQFDGPSAREQMTRREFGKGLAAIIGAGVAPSIALGTVSLAGSANAGVGGAAMGMMRGVGARNAAMFGWVKPYDKELLYVQNGYKEPLIDLGYKATYRDRYVCSFKFSSLTTQQNIFGANQNNGYYGLNISCYINGVNEIAFSANNGVSGSWTPSGIKPNITSVYKIDINLPSKYVRLYVDDTLMFRASISNTTSETVGNLFLFALNRDGITGPVTYIGILEYGTIYGFTRYVNGEIAQNLIPVSVGDKGYLYDTITKKIPYNVALNAGPEI